MLRRLFNSKSPQERTYNIGDYNHYFWNGFYVSHFSDDDNLRQLNDVLKSIYAGNLKGGFELISKYPTTKDLRPDVYSYNESFTKILISNNIPDLLSKATGQELTLAHIQLRIAYPDEKGYMEWHRDTHFYSEEDHTVGNVPPVHKLIFYPQINGKEEALEVLPGSNIRYSGNRSQDLNQVKKRRSEIVRISASASQFVLFNTFLLHSTLPVQNPGGAMRLIYSFAPKSQLNNFNRQTELHELYSSAVLNK